MSYLFRGEPQNGENTYPGLIRIPMAVSDAEDFWNVVGEGQVTHLSTNLQLVSPSPRRTGSQLGISGYEVRRLTSSETRPGERFLLVSETKRQDQMPPEAMPSIHPEYHGISDRWCHRKEGCRYIHML